MKSTPLGEQSTQSDSEKLPELSQPLGPDCQFSKLAPCSADGGLLHTLAARPEA